MLLQAHPGTGVRWCLTGDLGLFAFPPLPAPLRPNHSDLEGGKEAPAVLGRGNGVGSQVEGGVAGAHREFVCLNLAEYRRLSDVLRGTLEDLVPVLGWWHQGC